jgi:hypothetical protein
VIVLIVQVGGRVCAMSDEPFALSTIPPALPAEADYDALRAAVMHSPRGRWFLEEYARRNRQTDTLAVLAAIERIETVIRGDRNQHAYQHVRADLLEMAKTIAQTRAEVASATAGSAQEQGARSDDAAGRGQSTPPDIFATAERMQEVAWTMRERGIDPSTCVQIEALASSILSASSLRDPGGRRVQQLGEVLHYLERRIDTMLDNAAGTAAAAATVPEEPAPQTDHDQPAAHFSDHPDDRRSEIGPSQSELVEPAPAVAVATALPEKQSARAAEPVSEPQPSVLAEAFGTTSLDALLTRRDDAHVQAAAPSEPALESAPMDIDPPVAPPIESPETARTDSASEERLHAALEAEPLMAEASFEYGAAAPATEPEKPAELSAPAPAEQPAAQVAHPFAVPDVDYGTAAEPSGEAPAEPALPPQISATTDPLTPVSPMPVAADAPAPLAQDAEAKSECHPAPELFFPAVSFDTAPAVEAATRRQDPPVEPDAPVISEVAFSVVHQVQSDLDDLAATSTELEPPVAVTSDPIAIGLPALDVSGAAAAAGVTSAEPPADTAPAAPVEPAREVDVLSAAWESAVTFPPTATPSQAGSGVAADAMASGVLVPSMWEAPPGTAAAASHSAASHLDTSHLAASLAEAEPADFLLEPLTLTPANEPAGPQPMLEPMPEPSADPMREIEDELFATPPLPSPAAAIVAADVEPSSQQPVASPSAIPSATAAPATVAPAVPGSAAATARLAARTMPRPAFNDPLAALNAMSDEERIALFT